MKKTTQIVTALCLVACLANVSSAQKWGTLTMTFVYSGQRPAAVPIAVNKDVAFCGKFGLVDESLVINPKNSAIKNVVVYLRESRTKKPAVHPSYKAAMKKAVMMKLDNKQCKFQPRVAFVATNQKLMLSNSDKVAHNTKIDTIANEPVNPLLPAGRKLPHVFKQSEILPAVPISCAIHPWMRGYIVVRSHPYGAVSDKNGKITIKNIPVGKWTFQLWQEKAGYITKYTRNNKVKKWKRGRMKLTIKPGMNDLGTLYVGAKQFADKK